jgi:DNA-binding CsgD family transcriptional regulator
VAAGVLAESGERLAFRHGLIRQALYEGVPPAVRSGLHRHAAQALAGAGAGIEQVAEQLLAADHGADAWAAQWVADAAPTLIHRAPQVAVELLERVRDAGGVNDPRRQRLQADLVTALFLLGRYERVQRLAPALLAGTGDAAAAGRMAWTLAYALLHTARYEQALAVTARMLAGRALTAVWTARLRSLEALILLHSGHFTEAVATARQAAAEGQQTGDRLATAYALHARSLLQVNQQRDQAAVLETIEQALAVLDDDPEATDLRLHLLGNRVNALANLGRPAEADRAIGQALALAERAGTPPQLALTRLHAAEHWFHVGRWGDALAELDAVAVNAQPDPARALWLRGLAALIAVHRDDRVAAAGHLRDLDDLPGTTAEMRYHSQRLLIARGLAAERDGQPRQALAHLLAVFDPDSTRRCPTLDVDRYLWLPDLVRLALAVGDRACAEAAAEACRSESDRQPLPLTRGAADHCQGLLAADPTVLLTAADLFGSIGLPLNRAQALENAAALLAGHGTSAAARAAYVEAVQLYAELDAAWDLLRADARLRLLGIRRGSRGPRRRPTSGWEALTPTELKIAELVTAGRTNTDIAAGLLLSRRTVQSHVSHILTKLDAHSRIDIARYVSDRHRHNGASLPATV